MSEAAFLKFLAGSVIGLAIGCWLLGTVWDQVPTVVGKIKLLLAVAIMILAGAVLLGLYDFTLRMDEFLSGR